MRAVLVQVEGGQRVGAVQRLEDDVILGREPASADLVFPQPRVSARHARIERSADGHVLSDLGSSNGTRLNGEPLTAPVTLEPGDCIELGDAVTLYYETRARVGLWLGAAALVLIAGGVATALLLGGQWRTDPALEEAANLAREGLAAYEAGRPGDAKRSLNGAYDKLLSAGHLDDLPRLHRRDDGMRRLGALIGSSRDLASLYREALEESRSLRVRAATSVPRPRGPCRLEAISRADLAVCVRERAEEVLFDLWQEPQEVPEDFYVAVQEQLELLMERRRSWVERALERGRPMRDMMAAALVEAKVPAMLRYLAMIESGYETGIRSKAGARGMWQFMPRTARAYGLRVEEGIDERTDPEKSTRAAARYLRDLAFEFGGDALLLAIASYNKGENGIRRALKKLDDPRKDRSYWSLVENDLLPKETQEYVPRLVAAAVLGEAGLPPAYLFEG